MRIRIEIEMDNAAMQTEQDVADSLRKLAKQLDEPGLFFKTTHFGRIIDRNGNTVGRWTVH